MKEQIELLKALEEAIKSSTIEIKSEDLNHYEFINGVLYFGFIYKFDKTNGIQYRYLNYSELDNSVSLSFSSEFFD